MKSFRVWWSPQALEDLKEIYEFIYDRSPKGANIVFDSLLDLGDSLDKMPERFPIDIDISSSTQVFRFIPKWDYKIFYRVNHLSNLVIIARIFSTKQNPKNIEV